MHFFDQGAQLLLLISKLLDTAIFELYLAVCDIELREGLLMLCHRDHILTLFSYLELKFLIDDDLVVQLGCQFFDLV